MQFLLTIPLNPGAINRTNDLVRVLLHVAGEMRAAEHVNGKPVEIGDKDSWTWLSGELIARFEVTA